MNLPQLNSLRATLLPAVATALLIIFWLLYNDGKKLWWAALIVAILVKNINDYSISKERKGIERRL